MQASVSRLLNYFTFRVLRITLLWIEEYTSFMCIYVAGGNVKQDRKFGLYFWQLFRWLNSFTIWSNNFIPRFYTQETWKHIKVPISLHTCQHLLSSLSTALIEGRNCYFIVVVKFFSQAVLSIFSCAYWPSIYLWKNVSLYALPTF